MSHLNRPERRRLGIRSLISWTARFSGKKTLAGKVNQRGQSMTEYALIATLVCLAIVTVMTATGPTIGNIFSNTVYNLIGQNFTPYNTLSNATHDYLGTALASFTPVVSLTPVAPAFQTNTPVAPTCEPAHPTRTWAPPTLNTDGSITFNGCP